MYEVLCIDDGRLFRSGSSLNWMSPMDAEPAAENGPACVPPGSAVSTGDEN